MKLTLITNLSFVEKVDTDVRLHSYAARVRLNEPREGDESPRESVSVSQKVECAVCGGLIGRDCTVKCICVRASQPSAEYLELLRAAQEVDGASATYASLQRLRIALQQCSIAPFIKQPSSSDVAKLVEAAEVAECLLRNLGHTQDAAEVDAALAPWRTK